MVCHDEHAVKTPRSPMRTNFRAVLAYDGSQFFGYGAQPELKTVQGTLDKALTERFGTVGRLVVGGRTDKGVHALRQVISFKLPGRPELSAVSEALSTAAPGALWLQDLRPIHAQFHAQFHADGRSYAYLWPHQLSQTRLARLRLILAQLIGTRCFAAFARRLPQGKNTVRQLRQADAYWIPEGTLLRFSANGFLRQQVRCLVSTALHHSGLDSKLSVLAEIAASQDPYQSEQPAPPEGLYLTRISYSAYS